MNKQIISIALTAIMLIGVLSGVFVNAGESHSTHAVVDISKGASYTNQGDSYDWNPTRGALEFASHGGNDPWMEFYGVKDNQVAYPGSRFFSAAEHDVIALVIATDRADEFDGEMFYKVNSESYSAERSFPLDYTNTEEKQAIIVDMSTDANWKESITGIRLDVFNWTGGADLGPTNADNVDSFYHIYGLALFGDINDATTWASDKGVAYINGVPTGAVKINNFDMVLDEEDFPLPVAGESVIRDEQLVLNLDIGQKFSIGSVLWFYNNGTEKYISLDDFYASFLENTTYYLAFEVLADEDCEFVENNISDYTLNGKAPVDYEMYTKKYMILYYEYGTTGNLPVAINGFDLLISDAIFPKPVAGESTMRNTDILSGLVEDENFSLDVAYWSTDEYMNIDMEYDFFYFDKNTTYYLQLFFTPNDGYIFDEEYVDQYLLAGQAPVDYYIYDDGSIELYYEYGTTGDLTAIDGFNLSITPEMLPFPVAGEGVNRDVTPLLSLSDGKNFSTDEEFFAWAYYEEDGDEEPLGFLFDDEESTFEAGKKYYFMIGLTAKSGYEFDADNTDIYKLNGKTPKMAETDGKFIVLMYEYEPANDQIIPNPPTGSYDFTVWVMLAISSLACAAVIIGKKKHNI